MRQATALRNAARLAERLHEWGGVVQTPKAYWSEVKFYGLWLFGSTARGKKEPADIDIMYALNEKCGVETGNHYPLDESGVSRALIELRRGVQRVRFHNLCHDAFALDHGAIELYPNNKLNIPAILVMDYVPVQRVRLDTKKARRTSDEALGRWCPTQAGGGCSTVGTSLDRETDMKIQQTLYGYTGPEIEAKVTKVQTMGGGRKEVVTIPTPHNTVSHWNVERTDHYLLLTSGTVTKRVACPSMEVQRAALDKVADRLIGAGFTI